MADWTERAARPVIWARAANPGAPFPFVLFTRIQAWRNFRGEPFPISATAEACERLAANAIALAAAQGLDRPVRLADLPPGPLRLLRERHLRADQPVRLPAGPRAKRLILGPDEARFAWVHEGEHLVFHHVHSGLLPAEALGRDWLPPAEDAAHPYARSRDLGFLASDPARVGPGISFRLLVHLPGLVLARNLGQAHAALSALGAALRPVVRASPGEVPGALPPTEPARFWIESRGGLGGSAEDAYARFRADVEPLLRWEAETQSRCLEKHRNRLEDRLRHSLRVLSESATLTPADFQAAASWARLGAYLGRADAQMVPVLEDLYTRAQSGHLEVSSGRILGKEEEDIARANVVRLAMERGRI